MSETFHLPPEDKAGFYDRLRSYAQRIDVDPQTNSVFWLAQDVFFDLSSGRASVDGLKTVLNQIEEDLFDERVDFLREQHGLPAAPAAESLKSKFSELAAQGFDAFKSAIEKDFGGIVFTAHPTFANSPEVRHALANRAAGGAAKLSDLTTEQRLPGKITLEEEHSEAQAAITLAQKSLQSYLGMLLDIARTAFPDEWKTLVPSAPTLASWVTYDIDGRNDIAWWTSVGFRLQEKSEQLNRYAKSLSEVQIDAPLEAEKSSIVELLRSGAVLCAEQAKSFFEDLNDPEKLVEAANLLTQENDARIVSLSGIRQRISDLIAQSGDAAAKDLMILSSEMATLGLGTATIHLRINAAQLQSVLRRDLGLATEDHDIGQVALDTLARGIKEGSPIQINFSDLFLEQATAKRQLMLCAQISKHIDSDRPIRFLIAESENPATVLGALYLADLYGVSDKLDISPLFETPEALENGGRFIERLLQVEAFRDYVQSRNQLSIQLGFSDAGRFIGQVSADIAIERIQNQIVRALAKFCPGTPLLIFNTHGESPGRGAWPGPFSKRLAHVLPHKTISNCEKLGIPLRHEVSFQGGDGYLHFNEQILSDTALFAFIDYSMFVERTDADDPFYTRSSLVWDFYRALRQWHESLFDDPSYGVLLSDFAGCFLIDAGSRPRRRSGGPTGPRSLRAISHNATLQQLGVMANTACGIGSSLEKETDDLVELINKSPRFRSLIDLAVFCRMRTSVPSLRGYAAVYSPSFWVASSKRSDAGVTGARVTIARLLENAETQYAIMSCANKFSIDLGRFDRLIARLDDAPSVESRHEARLAIHTIHAIRQGAMMRAMEIAGSLPVISTRLGFNVADIQTMILNMQLEEAIERLKTLYPRAGVEIEAFSKLHEPRSVQSDISPRDYANLHEEWITPLEDLLGLLIQTSQAISHAHFAYG